MTYEDISGLITEAVASLNSAIAKASEEGIPVYGNFAYNQLPDPIFGESVKYASISGVDIRAVKAAKNGSVS